MVLKRPKDFGLLFSKYGVVPYNGFKTMKVFLTQTSEIPSLGLGAMHYYKHPPYSLKEYEHESWEMKLLF